MSAKMNVPELRFGEFSGEWEEKKLGEITSLLKDGTHGTHKDTPSSNYLLLSAKNIQNGKIKIFNDDRRISECDFNNIYKNYILQDGDILLTIVGTIGRTAIFHNLQNIVFQRSVAFFRFDEYVSKFMYQIFNTLIFQNELNKRKVISAQPGIYLGDLSKISLNLPSKPEQEKIASFLSSVDSKIEQLSKKKTLLEQYKKGVMQKIFSQTLRFKDEDGSDFPEWEYKNGNLIFETITNKKHNSDLPILAITQEFGAIPRDMIDFNISVTDKSVDTYKVVEIGDFIISLRSFQGGIEYSMYKGICSPAYIILRKVIEIDSHFFKSYFKTENYIKLLNKNIEGIRDGKMISYKQFSEIKLPYPSLKEQTKIANFLSSLDKKIELTDKELNATKEFKKALLQKMFV